MQWRGMARELKFTETVGPAIGEPVRAALAGGRRTMSRVIPDDPKAYARTRSLGDMLTAPGNRPIHIIYVHGMSATGRDNSLKFREALAAHLASTGQLQGAAPSTPETRRLLEKEPWPKHATINATTIWNSDDEWNASKPFVERYTFHRVNQSDVVVDDINWWPLLFALKCRFILSPDADLAGADREHLEYCARTDAPYYPWLTKEELQKLVDAQPTAGPGASLNVAIKRSIMNWGLSDAAMAMGPMRFYFRKTMNEAFNYATRLADQASTDQDFVVISASLGSFVVLDALFNDDHQTDAARQVATQNSLLYFFANQWALLELARIQGLPSSPQLEQIVPTAATTPVNLLQVWAAATQIGVESAKPKQIIAYSDPSDILTYRVPKIKGAIVVNLYDRNEINWFWLFANPMKAHTGHAQNPAVLRSMFATHNPQQGFIFPN
jgi:hypothetical protein